ncbi:4'-phosphopantetheinyl transferase family protein [Flavobacterium franklandianum]|uniref:4'-phosphopantetheinyl transferase superfamily protein n=1 Tax=Flavobacterium franklandianum TaxID=2594430 RepID=A0A553CU14_9FLAO|nr:4'-phosphopantetheinyl transferase superfamily protein [Flavobacterium franklandianum]TRX24009.1 4'-phosphopantetheinyl transferase superfamily protein [Flavobacterium franklandianum]
MPLYKIINFSPTTRILVWKITESLEDLLSQVVLKEKTQLRLNEMKSELHQRGFLSVRMLLKVAGFNDFDLHYDEFGKPYLNPNERHTEPVEVSITHSHHFSAIIFSEDTVGIDIELQREKIIRIADKFINEKELSRLRSFDAIEYIKKLTVKWGAKEAIFKIRNEKGISFKDHIQVNAFELNDKKTIAKLHFEGIVKEFNIIFEEFENFTLVYAFEK